MSDRHRETIILPLPGGGALHGDVSWGKAKGPALLFVPGFGSSRRGQKSEALEAACARRGWPFAAFDLRGHGDSSGTLHDLRPGGLQDDLDHVADALAGRGFPRLVVVGSSMGGWAACWFARRRPERVAACAALAPAFRFPGSLWHHLEGEVRDDWRQTGVLTVFNEARKRPEELSIELLADAERWRLEELAAGWATPLLLFHGVQDDVVPWTDAVAFLERAGTAAEVELRLYAQGDHRLLEYKDEMAEAICAFVERRAPSA
jgi:pimeloyl-ACP methyl ester carboxylesterase